MYKVIALTINIGKNIYRAGEVLTAEQIPSSRLQGLINGGFIALESNAIKQAHKLEIEISEKAAQVEARKAEAAEKAAAKAKEKAEAAEKKSKEVKSKKVEDAESDGNKSDDADSKSESESPGSESPKIDASTVNL